MASSLSGAAGSMSNMADSASDIFDSLNNIKYPSGGSFGGSGGAIKPQIVSKYHEGTKFVKKKKTPYDEMFGIKDDETLSILKVGEAVVPKDENLKMTPSGNYLDKEVSDNLSKMTSKTNYISNNSSDSSFSIGDIIIQGNADENTVLALKKERENIVQSVFDRIQSHTQRSGFRNMKLYSI